MPVFARLLFQSVEGGKVRMDWGFFDPAGPFDKDGVTPALFYRETMLIPPDPDLVKRVQDDLLAIGKRVAAAQAVSRSLAVNVPVGTELQVS